MPQANHKRPTLATLRESAGLSQEDLGPNWTISRIENGHNRRPSVRVVERITARLNEGLKQRGNPLRLTFYQVQRACASAPRPSPAKRTARRGRKG